MYTLTLMFTKINFRLAHFYVYNRYAAQGDQEGGPRDQVHGADHEVP